MDYVLLAEHDPDICPTANAKTRQLVLESASQIPAIAERLGVKMVAGPYVNREHLTVVVVQTDDAENLDRFLLESRLPQWNKVRVLPSKPLQEGIREFEDQPLVF